MSRSRTAGSESAALLGASSRGNDLSRAEAATRLRALGWGEPEQNALISGRLAVEAGLLTVADLW